ncbi:hypothetical protein KEM54_000581 [Ascosphaera aggregata]|nr:hypothetical protein KEM54_000581 [Ascosphaera aggregata]
MDLISQNIWLATPKFTEKELPDQAERDSMLKSSLGVHRYGRNGVVYIAGRNKEKAEKAIADIRKEYPDSAGRLEFLHVDLSDLTTIGKAAQVFMSKENRLDVLTNNAGVMFPPTGSKSEQGYELQMGTNCLGPYLLTKYLLPILTKTAASSPPGSVRVTWAASYAVNLAAPKNGVEFENGSPKTYSIQPYNYSQSKAGNILLASEMDQRFKKDGIISLAFNPGNLKSGLQRHLPSISKAVINASCYPAVNGAYTELFAGWSKDITLENSTSYIIPFGRIGQPAWHIRPALKDIPHGGTGVARAFWEWCDKETSRFIPSLTA